MPGALFSSSWYRVAELRPRLRAHAHLHRHVYRGEPWYVLEDVVNQQVHRFSPATQVVIGLMDGSRSVEEVWEASAETLGDDAPTQDELIRLLAQLHAADVLQSDVPPDTAELLQRFERQERMSLRTKLLSPLAVRLPILDPDEFLKKLVPFVHPLMGWTGFALWLAVVAPAVVLAGVHWNELTEGVLDHLLAPRSLVLIWLLFPVIKMLHELGHGIITRHYGGEVHDMGVMLLVLTPIPYVDASSASAFPNKRQRALVSAGGMIAEVFVAAVAMYLWLGAEPGTVRTLAYNTMLIGGITTLTFNANPLLRFDGYYILSDLLEIPNLRQRANGYVLYLFERYALGHEQAEPPRTTGIEPFWLVLFSVAAFVYRFVVVAVILLFVLDLSLLLGFVLAAVSSIGWVLMPLAKGVKGLFSPRLRRVRSRALLVVTAIVGGLLALALVPLPFRTHAEGVVWVPDEAMVRAETEGFVQEFLAEPGTRVERGQPLIATRNEDLLALERVLEARVRGLRVRFHETRRDEAAQAALYEEQIRHLEQRLARTRQRAHDLVVAAQRDGVFVVPRATDLPGRYVSKGELLGYVLAIDHPRVRAVVPHEDVELARQRLQGIAVRRAERLDEVVEARFVRIVPSAVDSLPSVALGSEGGGEVAVDPRDVRGTTTVQPVFEIELELLEPADVVAIGSRVHVRLDHGRETLLARGFRSLRQLFLARFDV